MGKKRRNDRFTRVCTRGPRTRACYFESDTGMAEETLACGSLYVEGADVDRKLARWLASSISN